MSAVGTILLQSPGWNEGKARYETLGKQGAQKLRAPLERHYNVSICPTSRKCRPCRALCRNEYDVLTEVFTRKYKCICAYLQA